MPKAGSAAASSASPSHATTGTAGGRVRHGRADHPERESGRHWRGWLAERPPGPGPPARRTDDRNPGGARIVGE